MIQRSLHYTNHCLFFLCTTQDYPSIGQISEALRDLDAIPIFAAEGNVRELYDVRIDLPVLHFTFWAYTAPCALSDLQFVHLTLSIRMFGDP